MRAGDPVGGRSPRPRWGLLRHRALLTVVLALLPVPLHNCTCGSGVPRCVVGELLVCGCPHGRTGFQVCEARGRRFSECECPKDGDEYQVDIDVSPAHAVLGLEAMAPGDVTRAVLRVRNRGWDRLRYAVVSTTSNDDLAGQLDLTVALGANGGCESAGGTMYGPAALGSTAGITVVGNTAQGGQSGDRELGPTETETLCLTVRLPIEAGNALQGQSTSMTLRFEAEQVEGNP